MQKNESTKLRSSTEDKKAPKRNIASPKDHFLQGKTSKSKRDIFPDDSFNVIASQIPESELNGLEAKYGQLEGASSFSSPASVRLKNSMNQQPRIFCSTPKQSMPHNDSSFETQMSQMNDSQFKNFMNNC